MGTSTSHRSPPTPRWNAVLAAYRASLGVERTTSELFNAATVDGWLVNLQEGPLIHYAREVEALYEYLPARMENEEASFRGVQWIIERTRSEALDEFGGDLTLAIGDRAFARLLLLNLQTDRPFADLSAADAAKTWIGNRPESAAILISGFLREVLRELVLHITIRDLAGLVGSVFESPAEARRLSRSLADKAAELARDDDFLVPLVDRPQLRPWQLWPRAMDRAFERGRALLGNGRG